ncbi:hypothetical protein AVEN_154883-1 [Araneus ventricosus]|uniref:Uncharacterized protein n=1 Tax=Araneus ventricosus TaxID=182803 RepID=A0A4Y2A782_ARAVE|nr:hypothetical protein AVEN_154883-1 [Araneus ventricosus]
MGGTKNKQPSKGSALTKKAEITLIEKLAPETYFSETELKYLIKFFKKHSGETAFIEKPDFLEMLHEVFGYTEHFFMNRATCLRIYSGISEEKTAEVENNEADPERLKEGNMKKKPEKQRQERVRAPASLHIPIGGIYVA